MINWNTNTLPWSSTVIQRACEEIFGHPKGIVSRCLEVGIRTDKVFGRLGLYVHIFSINWFRITRIFKSSTKHIVALFSPAPNTIKVKMDGLAIPKGSLVKGGSKTKLRVLINQYVGTVHFLLFPLLLFIYTPLFGGGDLWLQHLQPRSKRWPWRCYLWAMWKLDRPCVPQNEFLGFRWRKDDVDESTQP